MQLTTNSFRQLFPDKIFSLTFPRFLVKSLTFPWQLSNSLTFPGFPDKRSPVKKYQYSFLIQYTNMTDAQQERKTPHDSKGCGLGLLPTAENCCRPGLRSISSSIYWKPRLHTKFAECAFSFSGPAEWNCLPSDLRTITDTTIFKKKFKAYFYKQAFFVL